MTDQNNNAKLSLELSRHERRLIEELRRIPYGQVTVVMRDGQPAKLENIKESILLDN